MEGMVHGWGAAYWGGVVGAVTWCELLALLSELAMFASWSSVDEMKGAAAASYTTCWGDRLHRLVHE